MVRSSHWRCSVKSGVIKNLAKFTGKHLYQSLFFNKVGGLSPATLLKKRLWHRHFPVNFAKSLRTPFLQNTSWRLVLHDAAILVAPTKYWVKVISIHLINKIFPSFQVIFATHPQKKTAKKSNDDQVYASVNYLKEKRETKIKAI